MFEVKLVKCHFQGKETNQKEEKLDSSVAGKMKNEKK